MPTISFRELERVLKKMGFDEHPKKKGTAWVGISPINSSLVTIIIHKHAGGRPIPNGLMNNYIKNLGFNDNSEFQEWIDINRQGDQNFSRLFVFISLIDKHI